MTYKIISALFLTILLDLIPAIAQKGQLHWPLKPAPGFSDPGYYHITYYVSWGGSDYTCGNRAKSGHNGTDIGIGPFRWHKMDNNQVHVIAAFPGIIVDKRDGEPSKNCEFDSYYSNKIVIRHSDGSEAYYLHLKEGSVTTKKIGDAVAFDEYLGVVGSSGYSNGPHLHFELYDSDGSLVDPFFDSHSKCNPTTSSSWWADQKPYDEFRINALVTHGAKMPYPDPQCYDDSFPNIKNVFEPGDSIRFAAYYPYKDPNGSTTFVVNKPDGTVWKQWWKNTTDEQYFSNVKILPSENSNAGIWKFKAFYNGVDYSHDFTVKGIRASIADTNICQGDVTVLLDIYDVNPITTFVAELSDSSGDFTYPSAIGVSKILSLNTIKATIPWNTLSGKGYKIRVRDVNSSLVSNSVPVVIGIGPSEISGGEGTYSGSADAAFISGWVPDFGGGGYTYQWYSSPDKSNWAPIAGATNNFYLSPAITNTTYYKRNVASSNGCSISSNVISRLVAPAYCTPVITSPPPAGDWILGTTISNELGEALLNPNNSGNGYPTGYTNFILEGTFVNLHKGQPYTLAIKGQSSLDYYKAWIDYNRDGDFDDAGELIFNGGPKNNVKLDNFFIDPSASIGLTAMRVALKRNSSPESPCGIAGGGEIEDYGIFISPPCLPVDYTITSLYNTSANFQINGSSNSYEILSSNTNGNLSSWNTSAAYGSSVAIPLDESTNYLIRLRAVCGTNNFSDYGNYRILDKLDVKLPNGPWGKNVYAGLSSVWINDIDFGGGKKSSAGASTSKFGYQDFSRTLNLSASSGGLVNFAINPAPVGTIAPYYARVWMDLNMDGNFDNTNELMFTSQSHVGSLQPSFIVPSCIPTEDYRIRVMILKDHVPASAYENYIHGETEDYKIHVTGASSAIVNGLTPGAICHGSLSIPYHTAGSFSAGNSFDVWLSSPLGSWATSVKIGSIQSTAASGIIDAFIPYDQPSSNLYKIRISSSSPYLVSCYDVPVILGTGPNNISGGNGTYCGQAEPVLITGSSPNFGGDGNYTYQWMVSLNNSTWLPIAGATGINYSAPSTTQTIYYNRYLKSNGCVVISNVISRIITPGISWSMMESGNYGFCGPTDPPTLIGYNPIGGNGPNTYSFQWQSSADHINWSAASGQSASKDYDPSLINQTTYYRRVVNSGVCTDISSWVYVEIDQPVSNNSISTTQHAGNIGNYCGQVDPSILIGTTPTGGSGSNPNGNGPFYQWQIAINDFSSWIDIPGATSKDYDPSIISSTTSYRRTVSSGSCGPILGGGNQTESNVITFNISAPPSPQAIMAWGTAAPSSITICATGGSVTLNVPVSVSGVSYQWKKDGAVINNAFYNSITVNGGASNAGVYSVAVTTCSTITSNSVNIIMSPTCTSIGYCTSRAQSGNNEWIDKVQLGSLDNTTSNDGGYGDYTYLIPPDIRQGGSYSLNFSGGISTPIASTRIWTAWIDFNQDGDFTDGDEQIMSTSSGVFTGMLYSSFVIPSNAKLGYSRMRISMKCSNAPGPCEIFTYGEVEDYTVNIADPNGGTTARSKGHVETVSQFYDGEAQAEKISIYPNPVMDVLTLKGIDEQDQMTITNAMGIEIFRGNAKKEVDVKDLPSGIYVMIIQSSESFEKIKFVKL